MRSRLLASASILLLAGAAPAHGLAPSVPAESRAEASTPNPFERFEPWGVDLGSFDRSVRPGDDFEQYVNGGWRARTEIPADQTSAGAGADLHNLTQEQLRTLITEAGPESTLGALYQSFMDEDRIEALGAQPIRPRLSAVAALRDHEEFTRFMGASKGKLGSSLFQTMIYADMNNPTMNTLLIGQGGLALPERDYYLDARFADQRAAYRAYLGRTLRLIDYPEPDRTADAILEFETAVARASWSAAQSRDIAKLNNPMTLDELQEYAPELDWEALLGASGITDHRNFIVLQKSAIRDIARLYSETPMPVLRAWQAVRVASQASPYLSDAFVQSQFEFSRALSGTTALKDRWKRGVSLVDGLLGELVGQMYVERHFPAASKAQMEQLVANLKTAMGNRIRTNSWMSPETRQAALLKLEGMDVMVGYPDVWRDYSSIEVRPDDLLGNIERIAGFNWEYQRAKLGQPIDRRLWAMNPQTVNAYNGGLENKIVFPAGILQPPLFNPSADPAVNYGAIGAVIGHEITHGFDDQGRKIDQSGAVRNWWTPADSQRFEALAAELGRQYAAYEPVEGLFINPELTMGENIADLAGLQIAYDAYKTSLGGRPAPVIDGLTGDQRFFLAFAQAWQRKVRPEAVRQQVASDEHSPPRFRVLGPLRNLDAWYEAFDVGPDSPWYLAPEERVRIW